MGTNGGRDDERLAAPMTPPPRGIDDEMTGVVMREARHRRPQAKVISDSVSSDTATLLRAAAVVRDRRDVRDRVDPDAQRGERTHRGLAARAGATDLDVQVLDALLHGGAAGDFRRDLRGERRRLARALEALAAGGGPAQGVALAVGDRDDRVVEGRVNVADTVVDVLANLLAHALRGVVGRSLGHVLTLFPNLFLERLRSLARTLAGAGVGAGALAAHGQATAMAETAVAADVHQSLDVHRGFAAQVALD